MSERTEQEVRYSLARFMAARGRYITYRNQAIINIYEWWLDMPVDQRTAWLEKRLKVAEAYTPSGNQDKDSEMSDYRLIINYLLGTWDWTP